MLAQITFQGEGNLVLSAGFVSLRGVNKFFDDVHAVANLDLDVHAGEFFSMLGPSGSGKTTVLRLIAGLKALALAQSQLSHKMSLNWRPLIAQ